MKLSVDVFKLTCPDRSPEERNQFDEEVELKQITETGTISGT